MTTRVILVEPDKVIVAIDSLRRNPSDLTDFLTVCKLVRTQDFVFSATNFVWSEDYQWDAQQLAIEAARTGGSLADQVRTFECLVLDRFPGVLDQLKSQDSLGFQQVGGVGLIAAFVGVVNGKPKVFHQRFLVVPDGSGIEVHVELREPRSGLLIDGETNANRQLGKTPLPGGLIEQARCRVQAEIDAAPKLVGPPIDIVTVDAGGIHWVERQPDCKEIYE